MGQLKLLLYDSFVKMRFLPLWIPWSVFSLLPAVGTLASVAGPGQLDLSRLWFLLIMLAATPAVISGISFAIKDFLENGSASWKVFWRGIFKYYWRIVGGFVSLSVLVFVVGTVFSRIFQCDFDVYNVMNPSSLVSIEWSTFLPVFALVFLGNYFLYMWLPALAVEDTGILEAARLSGLLGLREVRSLLPVCALSVLSSAFLNQLGPEFALLPFTWQTIDWAYVLLITFFAATVDGYFRLVSFNLYHRKKFIIPSLTESKQTLTPPSNL